ncbi:MAG: ABC transporter ATP-binding protein [Deltaproteobacteria bacterium]|nr:ABC transporter ATP-binding protein [Deltaproteobacteria bacterium]
MIELDHISKRYQLVNGRQKIVLDDISHTFHEGTSVGILGLNGAGKSTLMRIICGTEPPTEGRVRRTSRVSWPIGFSGGLHKSLTGRENMRFTCRIYGADIKKVTDFVEDFSELGIYMDMPIRTYSSGMRARLAFGLSMAIGFDFYLIDEGYAVGDASFRSKSEKVFQERKANATCLVITHSTSLVQKTCDKAAVLENGKLLFFETVNEALAYYKEMWSARK